MVYRSSKLQWQDKILMFGGPIIGYLLGLDIGSSAVKASVIDADSGLHVASSKWPDIGEFDIDSPRDGWAEQDPMMWWDAVLSSAGLLRRKYGIDLNEVKAVGISYQMHGLVIVDKNHKPIRPSIIWCDSRAVETGESIADSIGRDRCLSDLLNLPGNFTASKLAWVGINEPDNFRLIHKAMLPGDFIAMMLTGEIRTTRSGLSEAILWDFKQNDIAYNLLDQCDLSAGLLPDLVDTFGQQGLVTSQAASELGLHAGIPVSYRAGDQPNNALSLNVLEPGEIAATAGTSGVVYGVTDKAIHDPESRVNTFLHVNNSLETPRNGVLLCVNGTGILNRWLRDNASIDRQISYNEMNQLASEVPVGSDGLAILPYGNGAERTLNNRNIGASVHNLDFNAHSNAHMFRAGQEGIVFALDYGVDIMRDMGMKVDKVRAGYANMFLSPVFQEAFANTIGVSVELYNTDGAQGAARGAGIGAGIFKTWRDAFNGLEKITEIDPDDALISSYINARDRWREVLDSLFIIK